MAENQLKYTSRDYESIKSDLESAINSVTTSWTSREESDPGMLLLNLMAYLGDNLSYNLDMQALEMYLPTVTQRKNIKKILDLIGYKIHWYRSAIVDVTISNNSANNLIFDFNINSENATNRLITYANNNSYTIMPLSLNESENIVEIEGFDSKTFIAVQGTVGYVNIDTNSISNNKFYIPDTNIDEAHLFLYQVLINTDLSNNSYESYIPWELINDLALLTESGRYFEFDTDEYDRPFIKLPSYWKEQVQSPSNGSATLRLYYLLSAGADGNVSENAFYSLLNNPSYEDTSITDPVNITLSNLTNWNGLSSNNQIGYNPQSTDEARNDAKNYMNTYDTLVTLSDFEKFIRQQEGFNVSLAIDVQKAKDLNMNIFENNLPNPSNANQDRALNELRIKQYVCGYGMLKVSNDENEDDISGLLDETDIPEYTYREIKEEDLTDDYMISNRIPDIILDEDKVTTYHLNIYTIYKNYDTNYIGLNNASEWNNPANPNLVDTEDTIYPYRRYKVSDTVINGEDGISGINSKLLNAKIMNVEVNYATCRVFDWRAVGTIYLRKPVIQDEADTIIKNVVTALSNKFVPGYVQFGQKISYMDVIETIQNADSRIRYFDAGRDNKKLVDWSDSFDVDNYFNPISIMRFNQYSVPNNYVINSTTSVVPQFNEDENGNKLLIVDSSSIIK